MKKFHTNTVKGLAFSASALALVMGAPAWAQDAEEPAEEVSEEEEEQVDITTDGDTAEPQGTITVTGSRIVRDTFTSISPLQVITTDSTRNAGAFDPAQILQRDEAAAGTQIDATFQGFVLDNGPGSQTLNLRGLGADRTLLLINGRRLAPAGVEGAPTSPSINLLPSSLIDRVDLLLDGASSIYGSDAVAGVANVLLRKDFDGLELFASGNVNPQGGGDDYTVSASYGFNLDRGFFGIGAEFDRRDEVRRRDRDFLSGCDTHYEIDQNGNILTRDRLENAFALRASGGTVSTTEGECRITGNTGYLFVPFTFSSFAIFDPGDGNYLPDYDALRDGFGVPVDADGDGIQDVDLFAINTNGANLESLLIPEQKRYNVMAYGEYTLPGDMNITPFFEALYTRVDIESTNTGELQIFPSVPSNNQFNPCNFIAGGVDCRLADNILNGGPFLSTGIPLPVVPLIAARGDRDNFDVTQEQYRGVLGIRGDLPFVGPSWTFEVSGTYTKSVGKSSRIGIREDKLAFALGIDPTIDFNGDGIIDNDTDRDRDGIPDNPGDGIADDYDPNVDFGFGIFFPPSITACDGNALANPDLAMPDLLDGCVPVNLFSESLLGQVVGEFSPEEAAYLFDSRDFDTTYEQLVLSAYVTGDLFELPAGPVGAVFGAEYRKDEIDSRPDVVASNGLFFGFFSDRGAVGSKYLIEAFGEVDIPLQADKPWVRELNLNLSGRITDEEFYGTNGTFSIKGGWRPVDPLLLRMSYGTSFRAPNLRENFLLGQTGFLTLFDPCAVPDAAFVFGAYDPSLDTRDAQVLANCVREGRDPTSIGINQFGTSVDQFSSVEISNVGSLELEPETSRSITAGAAFEEVIGDGFDVSLSVNYYDIKIKQSIIEPSPQFAINQCFLRQDDQRSEFCDGIFPGVTPGSAFLIEEVQTDFLNIDTNSVRGFDFNAEFGKEVTMFGKLVDLGIELRANHLVERSTLFINDAGEQTFDDDAGEFGLPEWTGRATFTAEYDKWLLTWQTRYIGEMNQDPRGVDPLADAFGNDPDGNPTGFRGNTCTGGGAVGVVGDGIYCRDIGFVGDYFEHAASIRYRDDVWEFRLGVTNIFDRAPNLVDCNEVGACISNVPLGAGYNLDGREYFATVRRSF